MNAPGTDVYVMDAGDQAFGWARIYKSKNIAGTKITLTKKENAAYFVRWFDPWTGDVVKSEKIKLENEDLVLTVPQLQNKNADISFKINKI